MELPKEQHDHIINKQNKMLELIKGRYEFKSRLVNKLINELETYKNDVNFDANAYYRKSYAPVFATIGGDVSGYVRRFKKELILELLRFMKLNYDEVNLFTLNMFQAYSKEFFNSSPTQKQLVVLLNKDMDLDEKLKNKKEFFGHSHVSKIDFSKTIGDSVNEKMKSVFESYYYEFKKERLILMNSFKEKEKEMKRLLKS